MGSVVQGLAALDPLTLETPAMGVQLDNQLIDAYAEAFGKRQRLMQAWIEYDA